MLVAHDGRALKAWCPACEELHCVTIHANGWAWDGNELSPTISPSIAVTGIQWQPEYRFHRRNHPVEPGERTFCHSYVHAGTWIFLPDSTHTLAGQTVPMVQIPEGIFNG